MSSVDANGENAIPRDDAPHLMIVDDDERIRRLLGRYLSDNGFRVTMAADAADARGAMRGLTFDLLILDVMMPGETGLEFAADLRSKEGDGGMLPILMLTAQADTDQRIAGLEVGVDDYLTKPFEPRELLLRINNVLRRLKDNVETSEEICFGEFSFHISRGELRQGDRAIKLTERERDMLRQFAVSPGQPISREDLAAAGGASGSERAVDVQINRLRRKIENDPGNPLYLQTVRGKGYILHSD